MCQYSKLCSGKKHQSRTKTAQRLLSLKEPPSISEEKSLSANESFLNHCSSNGFFNKELCNHSENNLRVERMNLHLGTSYYSGCTIPLHEFILMCIDLNLEYIEIQLEPPYLPSDMNSKQRDTLRNTLSSTDLECTLHAPYDDVNLSSLKEPIRRASIDIMKDCIDIAVELSSSILVLHAGACPANQLSRHDDAIQRFRASLLELAMYAHDRSIKIGVENKQVGLDREIILYPDEHLEIVQEYSDFDVGAVLDVGHANTAGIDLPKYVKLLEPHLIEMHIHDNDGVNDSHVGLGEGTADIEGVVRALLVGKFSGPTILELDSRESMEKAISTLKSLGA